MTGRPSKTPSLIRSKYAFRALVTGITFTAFSGMSAFAATHIHNAAAPLQPSANGTGTSLATPAPTARTRSRITTTGRIPTTQIPPRTMTRSS